MAKYKFIEIKQIRGEIFNKRPVYRIFNNKSEEQIGIISYYSPWRQYVFSGRSKCVFNISCLKDVIGFMENKTKKLPEKKKTPKQMRGQWDKSLCKKIRPIILEKYNYICQNCFRQQDKSLTVHMVVDHIHPIARGGDNQESNLWLLCNSCNLSKANKTVEEWKSCDSYQKYMKRILPGWPGQDQ
jgi:hypothetical protein